jgi:hypothetical protein
MIRLRALGVLALLVGVLAAAGERRAGAQTPACDPASPPYVFILFDTSGAMNWAPACSQAEFDQGICPKVCSNACWTQLHGDDPLSRLYQAKQALYNALNASNEARWGFATFNQDHLKARGKHWLYQAAGAGVIIPGWGPFPVAGSQEVFGLTWDCDTGSGDNNVGCHSTSPADLADAWERGRVQQLPKLGKTGGETVHFFVRQDGIVYKVRYAPARGALLGAPATVTETVWRCGNNGCGDAAPIGQADIRFDPVQEFLSWEPSDGGAPVRSDPMLSYFSKGAADVAATNTCSGWDPNDDTSADKAKGYDLRWPTVNDPRGASLSLGDVIPLDWQSSHLDDLRLRLAPNVSLDLLAVPDFRTSVYLEDAPRDGDGFLRLKDPALRPLIASGDSPLGNALLAFRSWWSAWAPTAQAQDPDFACRHRALVVVTGSDTACTGGADACTEATLLRTQDGVFTYVANLGVAESLAGSKLTCMAVNGGTGGVISGTSQLEELLSTITSILRGPGPGR